MCVLAVSLAMGLVLDDKSTDRGEGLCEIVRQAAVASQKNLRSGKGRGVYHRRAKGEPPGQFTFEIAFDGDKFNLKMLDLAHPRAQERPFDRRIVVSDGSATFLRSYADRVGLGSRTVYVYSSGMSGVNSAADMPMDPARASRGLYNPTLLENPSIRVVRRADGRVRGEYDVNKFLGAMFEASPESGYNVVLAGGFNKEGSRTGSRYTAEWKRDGDVWYVQSWTQEHWMRGENDERYELRYDEFVANPRLSPDLFTLQALELGADTVVADVRPGPTKVYNVGDPRKLAEKKLDTMAAQIESLPVRGKIKELEPGSRFGAWLWAINVIAVLAIAGIWYAFWRHRKRLARGGPF